MLTHFTTEYNRQTPVITAQNSLIGFPQPNPDPRKREKKMANIVVA